MFYIYEYNENKYLYKHIFAQNGFEIKHCRGLAIVIVLMLPGIPVPSVCFLKKNTYSK